MERIKFIPVRLLRVIDQYTRKLWVRVVLMGLMSIVALGLTQLLDPLLPDKIATFFSVSSADRLLNIIANAMLAVTTFSITSMVSVHRATSQQWSPRVHRLLLEDRTTQNTLAVFIGAYVYALIAIILRELGVYAEDRATVLFVTTVGVLAVIVVYLIRWVLHLQTFGSLTQTSEHVEGTTRSSFVERLRNPCLGANALTDAVPDDARVIRAQKTGYINQIFPEALNDAAKSLGQDVYLTANIGDFIFLNEPLAKVVDSGNAEGEKDYDEIEDALEACVVIGIERSFDQDPRFGLIAMGEIASKALSPGINDPGTAIDMINRVGRVLAYYEDETQKDRDEPLERLWVEPLDPVDLIEDGFGALSRDGAALFEVQHRLQKVLKALQNHPDAQLADAAGKAANTMLARAQSAMTFEGDQNRLKDAFPQEN
ncbi:DUF2254 domain-containing protein [uncultured Sulfitobacter sp.]|uniref:DUF2254 domain-containing protein n=1 Tax=uncultured Sulfitobacter sp. TaxID=191468 RepID=UPI002618D15F|nr:DUF2254 domain-containing protein [uncultured Sulfitobacter sp.]